MAAITSALAGNLSAGSIWAGGVPPGNGDTAVIGHAVTVDVNTIIGISGAAGVAAITVSAGGSVEIAAGVNLTVRGDFTMTTTTTLTLQAGASYTFDSSLAAGTPVYKIVRGSGGALNIIVNGTSGARCFFKKATGSGNGFINENGGSFTINAAYSNFNNLDDGAGFACKLNVGSNALSLNNTIWDTCARINFTCGATGHVDILNTTMKNTYGQYSIRPQVTTATTGRRTFTGCVWDKEFLGDSNCNGFDVSNSVFSGLLTLTGGSLATNGGKNLLVANSLANMTAITTLGTYELSYLYATAASNPHYLVINNPTQAGTFTSLKNVYECGSSADSGDCVLANADPFSAAVTINVDQDIVLPNTAGLSSGAPITVARRANNLTVNCNRLTYNMAGSGSESRGAMVFEIGGTNAYGRTGLLQKFRNCLAWDSQANRGYKVRSDAPQIITGTSSGGNTSTTLNDTSKTWPTDIWIANASTYRVAITGGTGVGQTRTITANTGTQLTVPAWGTVPDNTSTYKIFIIDVFAAGAVNYNNGWNHSAGTIADETGTFNGSGNGYQNYCLTGGINPGANDLNVDPQFVDSARNLAKWDLSLGGPGTAANALTEVKKRNDVSGYNAAYNVNALLTYVRAGFAPQNQALKGAGAPADGSPDIGAVGVIAGEVLFVGSTAGASTASGGIQVSRALVGSIDSVSALPGALLLADKTFIGAVDSVSQLIGQAQVARLLSGQADGVSGASAQVSREMQISGVLGAISALDGALSQNIVEIVITSDRRVFLLDTDRRVFLLDTDRRVFLLDTDRRVFKTQ